MRRRACMILPGGLLVAAAIPVAPTPGCADYHLAGAFIARIESSAAQDSVRIRVRHLKSVFVLYLQIGCAPPFTLRGVDPHVHALHAWC